jgi:hypothetical protein
LVPVKQYRYKIPVLIPVLRNFLEKKIHHTQDPTNIKKSINQYKNILLYMVTHLELFFFVAVWLCRSCSCQTKSFINKNFPSEIHQKTQRELNFLHSVNCDSHPKNKQDFQSIDNHSFLRNINGNKEIGNAKTTPLFSSNRPKKSSPITTVSFRQTPIPSKYLLLNKYSIFSYNKKKSFSDANNQKASSLIGHSLTFLSFDSHQKSWLVPSFTIPSFSLPRSSKLNSLTVSSDIAHSSSFPFTSNRNILIFLLVPIRTVCFQTHPSLSSSYCNSLTV